MPIKQKFNIKQKDIIETLKFYEFKQIGYMPLVQNPQLIENFETSQTNNDPEVKDYTLVILTRNKPSLLFHNLNKDKVVK